MRAGKVRPTAVCARTVEGGQVGLRVGVALLVQGQARARLVGQALPLALAASLGRGVDDLAGGGVQPAVGVEGVAAGRDLCMLKACVCGGNVVCVGGEVNVRSINHTKSSAEKKQDTVRKRMDACKANNPP